MSHALVLPPLALHWLMVHARSQRVSESCVQFVCCFHLVITSFPSFCAFQLAEWLSVADCFAALRCNTLGHSEMKSAGGAAASDDGAMRKGMLIGKEIGSVDFSVLRSEVSLEELFGNELSGAALLEKMLMWFQDAELATLPWYTNDGQTNNRNIVKAPQSRAIQESTIARYMTRIYAEGLSQVVSGEVSHGCQRSAKVFRQSYFKTHMCHVI